MKLFGYELCTPALVYFVIAVIITLVAFLLNLSMGNLFPMLSQLLVISLCALILTWICTLGDQGKVGTNVSWIITGLFVCMTTLGLIGALTGTGGITTPAGNIGNPSEPSQ